MSIKKNDLSDILLKSFPDAIINLIDMRGDEDHYGIEITSKEFNDMTRVQMHRYVNSKLKHLFNDGTLHAATFKLNPKN